MRCRAGGMILSFVLSVAGVSVQMPKRVNPVSVDEARTPSSAIDGTLGWVGSGGAPWWSSMETRTWV